MILLGCGSCGTFTSVNDVRALSYVDRCRFCASDDLNFADEFDLDALAKKPNPYATCPRCGAERAYRKDFQACMKCDYKGPLPDKSVTTSTSVTANASTWNASSNYTWTSLTTQASDDLGPGAGGFMSFFHELMLWLRGGHNKDEIPSWFPKRWLTPDEIRTHRWTHAGGTSMDYMVGSMTAAQDQIHSCNICGAPATHYVMGPYAGDWGDYYCDEHTISINKGYGGKGIIERVGKTAAPVLMDPEDEMYATMIEHGWKPGREYPLHTGRPGRLMIAPGHTSDEGDPLEPIYVPEAWEHEFASDLVHAHLLHTGVGVMVPVHFNPKGDPWTYLSEELGTYGVDHLEIQPDGSWAGVLLMPEERVNEAKQLKAAVRTAASGIFSTKDGTMVYGPTTPEAIEMAMAGGRYASDAYYVGTIPDHPNTEIGRPEPYPQTDPFADVEARTPVGYAHKIAEITEGIRTTNPGIDPNEAQRLAVAAVQKYPALIQRGDR